MVEENKHRGRFDSDFNASHLLQLPSLEAREQLPELINKRAAREGRMRKQQEKRKRKKIGETTSNTPMSTLSGSVGESKLRYLKHVHSESKKCVDSLHTVGILVNPDDVKNVLVPPNDRTGEVCEAHLSSIRSVFPKSHALNREHRKKQSKELEKICPWYSHARNDPPSRAESVQTLGGRLPRVASIDFKNRAKEARRRRQELQCTSPTVCWPQHLLDKLCLCMDDDGQAANGKNVLFNYVKL